MEEDLLGLLLKPLKYNPNFNLFVMFPFAKRQRVMATPPPPHTHTHKNTELLLAFLLSITFPFSSGLLLVCLNTLTVLTSLTTKRYQC